MLHSETNCKLFYFFLLLNIYILREKDVRDHLKNVYGTLTLCLATSVLGVIIHGVWNLYNFQFLFSIATFGFMLALILTEASRQNEKKRLAYMFALSFSIGCSTGFFVKN